MDVLKNLAIGTFCIWVIAITISSLIDTVISPTIKRWIECKNKTPAKTEKQDEPEVPILGNYHFLETGKGSFELIYNRSDGHVWYFNFKEVTQEAAVHYLARQLQCGLTQIDYCFLYRIFNAHYARHADSQCSGM